MLLACCGVRRFDRRNGRGFAIKLHPLVPNKLPARQD